MVNIVFHSVAAATDDSGDELEAQEDLLNDPVYDEVNPEVSQSSSGDFGLSQLYDRDKMYATPISIRGTVGYLAPELFMSSTATYKCDVFSFGILLFEIVGKRRNFYHQDETRGWFPQQVLDYFKKGKLEEFIIELGIDAKDREQAKKVLMVALWCIQYKPEDRPSMSSVVKILEGEIEIREPPCSFQFMAFPNEDSQVSITMHSDSMIVQEMNEGDSEDFPAVVDCDIEIFTPSMEKFEIAMSSSSESY
ncbi:Pr5-like receptor kinase [Thalictrum thalictroides]|uniref:Pr5-like receptor kinase n=1 Tax=Thalictrum thalictroides TaxID=46969 RepID=A0A7J6XBF2_THATH|nr:Pr5-like receptor kinase [Thalictrum thalictroides]